MKGEGVPRDPQKAVALFLEGIEAGDTNGTCMYFYALCYETGSGVRANELKALECYKKAAEDGNRFAIEWCRAHKPPVAFTPRKQRGAAGTKSEP
jgi:TPR repeat protein